jgi:hypothetical protein
MSALSETGVVLPYESRLALDRRWDMDEADRHFQRNSLAFKTMRKIGRRLDSIDVPYAVAGGMAVDAHGFRCVRNNVDILVSHEGLETIHETLDGVGYVRPSTGSKYLRDAEDGVRIMFLIAGEFPGDGKPKPVAFPEPERVSVAIDGILYLSLPKLVELKLASGMTGGLRRLKDFVDVIALIKARRLPIQFADELNPYVHDKYLELWQGIQDSPVGPVEPWPGD